MRTWVSFASGALLGLGLLGRAGAECVGDCNSNDSVAINEVITCVNIGLELLPLGQCDSCDQNGNQSVAINEIITSVNIGLGLLPCGGPTLTPRPTSPPTAVPTATSPPAEAICGDGVTDSLSGEDCDDGNNFGGDACAANCTIETRRAGTFTEASQAIVRGGFPITLPLRGTQALTTGKPRDVEVIGKDGQVVTRPGEAPIVIRAGDVKFEPAPLFGAVCACVRAVPQDAAFGPGNSGAGLISCTDEGLTDINVFTEQDHNTTPGDPGNSGPEAGLPDDPECDATIQVGAGLVSSACVEGTGEACKKPEFEHLGLCNSPRVVTRSGGAAGRGAILILNSTAIGLLRDSGTCRKTLNPDGVTCRYPDYGDDCEPCTEDDKEKGPVNIQPTTSGTADVVIYDANDTAGFTRTTVAAVQGQPGDCDALLQPGNDALAGTLVTAFPGLHTSILGDTATTSVLQAR